tara:strand:- start:140 stop:934 length:795 start_codon:yes stop_codon:yes gene_type:complete
MKTEFQTLLIEKKSKHILLLTLNRPEFSNAFNTLMANELIEIFEELSTNYMNYRVVILTGSGQKAFCAGGDLKERNGMSDQDWQAQHLIYERMIRSIVNCPLPIIGAVNGAAYGGGCELVSALDFAYASDNARFAQTEVNLGIIPGIGGTQNLARAIGEKKAKELILSGKQFSAQEALEWGLVNGVFAQNVLLEKTLEISNVISEKAPIAVRQAKQAIHKGLQMSLHDGMAFEIEAYNRTIKTDDRKEGIAAFNEKRKPNFKGQ